MFQTPKETEKAVTELAKPIVLTPAQIAEVAAGTALHAASAPIGTKGGIRVTA